MVEVSVPIKPFLCGSSHLPVCRKILVTKTWKFCGVVSSSSSCGYNKGRNDGQVVLPKKTRRVFFLDVNPLCYAGSKPSLHSFARWVSLFFNQVSLSDPVIAVSLLLLFITINSIQLDSGDKISSASKSKLIILCYTQL
jgi:hypothetical protein